MSSVEGEDEFHAFAVGIKGILNFAGPDRSRIDSAVPAHAYELRNQRQLKERRATILR